MTFLQNGLFLESGSGNGNAANYLIAKRYVLNNAKGQILTGKTVQTPLVANRIIKSTCMIFLKFLF